MLWVTCTWVAWMFCDLICNFKIGSVNFLKYYCSKSGVSAQTSTFNIFCPYLYYGRKMIHSTRCIFYVYLPIVWAELPEDDSKFEKILSSNNSKLVVEGEWNSQKIYSNTYETCFFFEKKKVFWKIFFFKINKR